MQHRTGRSEGRVGLKALLAGFGTCERIERGVVSTNPFSPFSFGLHPPSSSLALLSLRARRLNIPRCLLPRTMSGLIHECSLGRTKKRARTIAHSASRLRHDRLRRESGTRLARKEDEPNTRSCTGDRRQGEQAFSHPGPNWIESRWVRAYREGHESDEHVQRYVGE